MTNEPPTLLEREVNAIVRSGFDDLVHKALDCVCGHPAGHHDGFGCAEVAGPFIKRCGCENYVPNVPKDHPGSITSGDTGWYDE